MIIVVMLGILYHWNKLYVIQCKVKGNISANRSRRLQADAAGGAGTDICFTIGGGQRESEPPFMRRIVVVAEIRFGIGIGKYFGLDIERRRVYLRRILPYLQLLQ